VEKQVALSPAGEMVATDWGHLDPFYPVEVDAFVVMPNHVYGILVLREAARADRDGATVPTVPVPSGAMSLSTIIQRFKTFTRHEYGTGVATHGWSHYPGRLWPHRFHDHVIRSKQELAAIREYIAHNPLQWEPDRENRNAADDPTQAYSKPPSPAVPALSHSRHANYSARHVCLV
jgi:REP element-mobilizing transposase RayT